MTSFVTPDPYAPPFELNGGCPAGMRLDPRTGFCMTPIVGLPPPLLQPPPQNHLPPPPGPGPVTLGINQCPPGYACSGASACVDIAGVSVCGCVGACKGPGGVIPGDPIVEAPPPTGDPRVNGVGNGRGVKGNGLCCPSGYHPNKAEYFLKNGTRIPEGTKCVRNRRRNPLNPRALDRAGSRVLSAKKAASWLARVSIPKKRR
jgi:hypothetical protein